MYILIYWGTLKPTLLILRSAKCVPTFYCSFPQISTSVLQTWTTAVTMLCVETLRVVLIACAILASLEMVYSVQVSHYNIGSRFIGCMHACNSCK